MLLKKKKKMMMMISKTSAEICMVHAFTFDVNKTVAKEVHTTQSKKIKKFCGGLLEVQDFISKTLWYDLKRVFITATIIKQELKNKFLKKKKKSSSDLTDTSTQVQVLDFCLCLCLFDTTDH